MEWNKKKCVQKGTLGEELIDKYIHESGRLIPYCPVFDGAHPFDRIVASLNKKEMYILDVKTKARRSYYPDTGIDIRHYEQYKYLEDKYNMPVYLAFVDEWLDKIYGNYLSILEEPTPDVKTNYGYRDYPIKQKGIIYFPCVKMEYITILDKNNSKKLKELSTRTHPYPTDEPTPIRVSKQQNLDFYTLRHEQT